MPQTYLIDGLLKANLVNTIVGPSGSGKSKWVTQQLLSMHRGEPFFGHTTTALPDTYYVALDRPDIELDDLIANAKLDAIPNFRWASWRKHLRELRSLRTLLARFENIRKPQLLIIDGIGFLVPDIIKQREVGILFSDFDNWQDANPGTSVILIHHTAKAKSGMGYTNHREKALGSGAWAQCSGISISVSQITDEVTDNRRVAVIMSNNKDGLEIPFSIDRTSGLLVPTPDEPVADAGGESPREWSAKTGKSERTFYRHKKRTTH